MKLDPYVESRKSSNNHDLGLKAIEPQVCIILVFLKTLQKIPRICSSLAQATITFNYMVKGEGFTPYHQISLIMA